MNTPAHLIFGMAAFGKPKSTRVTLAALLGAMAPDLSLYLMAGTSIFLLGIDPQVVFDQLYFSEAWQLVFKIDNSFILWGIGLGLATMLGKTWAIALCGAALLHIAFDFPLHHDDGRAHFWPLSNWVFESPVSYWDRNHHAGWVAPIEFAVTVGLVVWMWRRFKEVWARITLAALLAMQTFPVFMWVFVFAQ
ncbi:MAG: cobalamin biosynthesis protein CobQ [Pseudomonadota bacterium]